MADDMPSVDDYYDNMYQNDLMHREFDALGVEMAEVIAECDRTGRTYDQQLKMLRTKKIRETKKQIEADKRYLDSAFKVYRETLEDETVREVNQAMEQIRKWLFQIDEFDTNRARNAAYLFDGVARKLHGVVDMIKRLEVALETDENLLGRLKADQEVAAANALLSSNKKRAAPAPARKSKSKSNKKQKTQV